MSSSDADPRKGECPVCMDDDIMLSRLECGHLICSQCIDGWSKTGSSDCPSCRRRMYFRQLRKLPNLPHPPPTVRKKKIYIQGVSIESKIALIMTLRCNGSAKVGKEFIRKYEDAFGIGYDESYKNDGVKPYRLALEICRKMEIRYETKEAIRWMRHQCCDKILEVLNAQLNEAELMVDFSYDVSST